jgi:hypothetical protein
LLSDFINHTGGRKNVNHIVNTTTNCFLTGEVWIRSQKGIYDRRRDIFGGGHNEITHYFENVGSERFETEPAVIGRRGIDRRGSFGSHEMEK